MLVTITKGNEKNMKDGREEMEIGREREKNQSPRYIAISIQLSKC